MEVRCHLHLCLTAPMTWQLYRHRLYHAQGAAAAHDARQPEAPAAQQRLPLSNVSLAAQKLDLERIHASTQDSIDIAANLLRSQSASQPICYMVNHGKNKEAALLRASGVCVPTSMCRSMNSRIGKGSLKSLRMLACSHTALASLPHNMHQTAFSPAKLSASTSAAQAGAHLAIPWSTLLVSVAAPAMRAQKSLRQLQCSKAFTPT